MNTKLTSLNKSWYSINKGPKSRNVGGIAAKKMLFRAKGKSGPILERVGKLYGVVNGPLDKVI